MDGQNSIPPSLQTQFVQWGCVDVGAGEWAGRGRGGGGVYSYDKMTNLKILPFCQTQTFNINLLVRDLDLRP